MRPSWLWLGLVLAGCTDVVLTELRAAANIKADLEVLDMSRVVFDLGDGDLVIVGDADVDMVEVDLTLLTDRPIYDGQDDEATAAVVVTLKSQNKHEAVVSFGDVEGFPRYKLSGTIHVPPGMAVDVTDLGGDLDLSTLGSIEIDDGEGDIIVSDVTGDLSIRNASGNIAIDGVSGDVVVRDGPGDITVANVGSFELSADEGGAVVGP